MLSKFIYAALGLCAGLFLGFVLTNEANRRETEILRAQLAQAQAAQTSAVPTANAATNNDESAPRLSRDEVRAAVAKADSSPKDVYQQRYLGQMLYLYAAQTDDTETLKDAARLLERAHKLDPSNYETLVLLGNAYFDLGGKSASEIDINQNYTTARDYYLKALQIKADDPNVRTDLGLTYFFAKPSDPNRALTEYRKSLILNPRHEATLQNMTTAFIAVKDLEQAAATLARLQTINANNAALPRLQAQLANARNQANNQTGGQAAKAHAN